MIERSIPVQSDLLEAVVEQLLLGVTPAEEKVGLRSSFSSYTAGQFHTVKLEADNVVVLDLTAGLVSTNNFSTSHMSMQVFGQLGESLLADPDVAGIELLVDGVRWCGWETGPCDTFPRPLLGRD